MGEEQYSVTTLFDHLKLGWDLIVSAGNGDWGCEDAQWQIEALRWRDRYLILLKQYQTQMEEEKVLEVERGHR